MSTPFAVFSGLEMWQIGLIILGFLIPVLMITYLVKTLSRIFKKSAENVERQLMPIYGPYIQEQSLKFSRKTFAPLITGKINGVPVRIQYLRSNIRLPGQTNEFTQTTEPGYKVSTVQIKLTDKEPAKLKLRLEKAKEIITEYGGKIQIYGHWFYWLMPQNKVGKNIIRIIKKLILELK